MAKQNVTVELFYDGDWQTAPAYTRDPITITRGQGDETSDATPQTLTLTLDNRTGDYNPRNAASPLWGLVGRNTPIRVSLDGAERFVGEVSSWKPGRSIDFNAATGKGDAWTEVEAAGVLRRLGQGADPVRSPLHRAHVVEPTAVGYWPLEDAEDANLFPSPLTGVQSGRLRASNASLIRPMTWDESTLIRSGTLPALESERGLAGVEADLTAAGSPALAASFWTRTSPTRKAGANAIFTQATLTFFLADGNRVTTTLLQWPAGSSGAGGTEDTVSLRASSTDSGGSILNTVQHDGAFVDGWRHVVAVFVQSGSAVAVTLYLDGAQVGTGSLASFTLDSVAWVRMGAFTQNTSTEEIGRVAVGHPAVLAGSTTDLEAAVGRLYTAGGAHVGETAKDRFERLCEEEGITATVVGDGDGVMGPQRAGVEVVELLGEIQRTDGGLMYEPRDTLGVTLRGVSSLYNQTAALQVDWSAYQVAPPFAPALDDLGVRNDVTARSAGSGVEARAMLESGRMSVQAPPDGVGRYGTQVEVNPAADASLGDHAGWALHKGTVDEMRLPRVTVDLVASPELEADAAAVDVGDRITVTGLPADMGDTDADLIVLGYTEVIGSHSRSITFNAAPASPYTVAEADGDPRVPADGSTLALELADTGMTLSLASTTANGVWTTNPAEFPQDLRVGGERVTASGISGSTSPQTVTLSARGVNGVQAAWPAGTEVDVWEPARAPL